MYFFAFELNVILNVQPTSLYCVRQMFMFNSTWKLFLLLTLLKQTIQYNILVGIGLKNLWCADLYFSFSTTICG